MSFTMSAWGPEGRGVFRLKGPIEPARLILDHDRTFSENTHHWWTEKEKAAVALIAETYPEWLPDGLAAKVAKQIGVTKKSIKQQIAKARKIQKGKADATNHPA